MRRIFVYGFCALITALAPSRSEAQGTIYLVRHAEKADGTGTILDEHIPLSETGHRQAEQLAEKLGNENITAIYLSSRKPEPNSLLAGPTFLRTELTAKYLLDRLSRENKQVQTFNLFYTDEISNWKDEPKLMSAYAKGAVDWIEKNQRPRHDDAILIVGHENTVPALIREFANRKLGAPPAAAVLAPNPAAKPAPNAPAAQPKVYLEDATGISRDYQFIPPWEHGLLYILKPSEAAANRFLTIERFAEGASTAQPGSVLYPPPPKPAR